MGELIIPYKRWRSCFSFQFCYVCFHWFLIFLKKIFGFLLGKVSRAEGDARAHGDK